MALFTIVSPLVEPLSIDEAFVDVTGRRPRISMRPTAIARGLKARHLQSRGSHGSIGVAPNKFLAKLASDFKKPDGLTPIREEDKVSFLRPLAVDRIWGVGPKTETACARPASARSRELQDFGGDLRRLMGSYAEDLRALAFGEDDRPVEIELSGNQSAARRPSTGIPGPASSSAGPCSIRPPRSPRN